jgi:hypothetical protein
MTYNSRHLTRLSRHYKSISKRLPTNYPLCNKKSRIFNLFFKKARFSAKTVFGAKKSVSSKLKGNLADSGRSGIKEKHPRISDLLPESRGRFVSSTIQTLVAYYFLRRRTNPPKPSRTIVAGSGVRYTAKGAARWLPLM